MKVQLKTELLWHILFADVMMLSLRLGGLSIIDLCLHAGFVLAAGAMLLTHERLHTLPGRFYLVFLPLLAIALLQLIPLPEALLPYLAPVKWRTGEIARSLYPDIAFSTQITMMPQLHVLKLGVFALDIYVFALMWMAPAPSRNTVRVWLFALAMVIGALATMEGKGLLDETSPLSYYMGTHGGLINPNHFACMAVLIFIPLVAQSLVLLRRAVRTYQQVKPVPIDAVVRRVLGAVALIGAALMLLSGFHTAYTRSGVVDMGLAGGTFGLVLLLTYRGRRRAWVWAAAVPVGLVALLMIPGQSALDKFEERGLEEHDRLDHVKSGLTFLKEWPLVGVGLGSTEGILNQITPRKPYRTLAAREFHNDFLQTLVELGPVGLICLLIFVFWMLHEIIIHTRERRFEHRAMGAALLGVSIMLMFHSSVSFPLRITSIRLLALILLAVFLKTDGVPRRTPRAFALRFLPLPLAAAGILLALLPTALRSEDAESYFEDRSMRHGRLARVALLTANRELQDIFDHNPPIDYTIQRLPYIRAKALEHLQGQVYSVRGLTLLFMVEILEERIDARGEFDPEFFARMKEKARIIGNLGENSNAHTTAPWMFLYATYAPFLNAEDKAEFDTIRAQWHYSYYKKQIEYFPETKGDWVAPPKQD